MLRQKRHQQILGVVIAAPLFTCHSEHNSLLNVSSRGSNAEKRPCAGGKAVSCRECRGLRLPCHRPLFAQGQHVPRPSLWGSGSGQPLSSCWGKHLLEAVCLSRTGLGLRPSQTEQLLCAPGLCVQCAWLGKQKPRAELFGQRWRLPWDNKGLSTEHELAVPTSKSLRVNP